MRNHSCSALITVYAENPGTTDAIVSALETIGSVSIVTAADIESHPAPHSSTVSCRIVVRARGDLMRPPARMELAESECAHIRTILERFGWRYTAAAKALGIDRSTLYRKMKKYDISKDF